MARISKEEKARIRENIIKVSNKYFIEYGYDETSTKQIAQEVGIAEGTLFNYFDNKSELFLEAVGNDIEVKMSEGATIEISDNIVETITNHMFKSAGMLMKVPKRILGEIVNASFKMAKKNPKRFKQFAEMDLKYMKDIEFYISDLLDKKVIREVDARHYSEIIYGSLAYELLMFIYDQNITKEEMLKNMKIKTEIIINGYLR